MSFLNFSTCTEEPLSTPKATTYVTHSREKCERERKREKCERASNPITKPLYTYLSKSALLCNFTAPNKQLLNVKSVFKPFNHVSSS